MKIFDYFRRTNENSDYFVSGLIQKLRYCASTLHRESSAFRFVEKLSYGAPIVELIIDKHETIQTRRTR